MAHFDQLAEQAIQQQELQEQMRKKEDEQHVIN